ncbi:MAG: transglutaminase domain-containing protein [Flavobacterium sp.]
MKFVFQLTSLFFFSFVVAQVKNEYATIDAIMNKIPAEKTTSTTDIADYITLNFKSESDKIRAAFYWTANNISYDIENMNEPNFVYSSSEKIASALKSKKGVCIHYAEVYNEIANKLGVKTVIVVGYTKQNGVVSPIGHAWNASKIEGKWFLFDPTWGAGYVNNLKFYKKLNNNFFKTSAAKMIQTHMPFDYLWQFSNEPITNHEFFSGIIQKDKPKMNFNFDLEIEKYETRPKEEQAFEAAERIEKNAVINNLIAEYLASKKEEFNVIRQNKNIEKVAQIVLDYNSAVASLNDFVFYRNNKFKPLYSDEIISEMINTPLNALKKCQDAIYGVGSVGKDNTSNLKTLKSQMAQNIKIATEHAQFVKDYLSKNKIQRKLMFTKIR